MSVNTQETAAIILDCRDHGESDKIVTIFSCDNGRITGIAKGANKSKKRFLNKLELFSYINLSFNEKQYSTLVLITEAELLSSFINLRKNIPRYNCATFIREALLIAAVEREADKDIFNLLHWSLQALNKSNKDLAICAIFLVRLINHLGYCPNLTNCHNCGEHFLRDQQFRFHHMSGGLICRNCTEKSKTRYGKISAGTIRILQSVLTEPLERLHRLHFSRQALNESLNLLYRYSRILFQKEIQSWKSLQDILRT